MAAVAIVIGFAPENRQQTGSTPETNTQNVPLSVVFEHHPESGSRGRA
jgi:hypothetical protein